MDFNGKGVITESDFCNGIIVKRLHFDMADIKDMLYKENLFVQGDRSSKIDYDLFKKAFFPYLFHVEGGEENSDDEI
jgi:hypothetical protein